MTALMRGKSPLIRGLVFADRKCIASSADENAAAALIAVGVLYAVDAQYNNGRYSAIIEQAITSLASLAEPIVLRGTEAPRSKK